MDTTRRDTDLGTETAAGNALNTVSGTIPICQKCLDGAGGICHHPACLFCRSKAPDIPLRWRLENMYQCSIAPEYAREEENDDTK